jgi:hypothetical protein
MSHYKPPFNVPETVKVAICSPPGAVVTVFVPGDTVNLASAGPLIIIIPEPPFPPFEAGSAPSA